MKNLFFILFSILIISVLNSCNKDKFYMGSDNVLEFEVDTLTFDTVFTTVGTVTRYFKVNNTSNQDLFIDEIKIVEDAASPFRINVDGVSAVGSSVKDVQILAEDYIYIFVEATLGENNANNPLIIVNELQYSYNNNVQSSYLQAWGQDAYFHYGEVLSNEDVVWNNDKPHVVVRNDSFPGVGVDSFSTLTILPGCDVYLSVGSGIYVDGELTVGEPNNMDSVTFQSDRVEDLPNGLLFEEIAGLWETIGLLSGSKGSFYNVRIKQSTNGISGRFLRGTFSEYGSLGPEIIMDKVAIDLSLQNALVVLNGSVTATNCLFHTAGSNLVALALGGDYTFDNCTFYNTGGFGLSHDDATLALSNFASNGNGGAVSDLNEATFNNCIVYGSLIEELSLNNDPAVGFNYAFNHCSLKSSLATEPGFTNCQFNENPLFVNTSEYNFRLDENSPCIDAGIDNSSLIQDDISFQTRSLPNDIGCYEYIL